MEIIKVFNIKELAQEFIHPPKVEKKGEDIALMFDYETDTGEYKWTGITFKDAVDYRHTNEKEINEYMIKAYNSVVEVQNSSWRNKNILCSKHNVDDAKYNHYLVYFDGYGAYEFLSADVEQGIME